jgi:hypothetical protein
MLPQYMLGTLHGISEFFSHGPAFFVIQSYVVLLNIKDGMHGNPL